jgi:hypothetical protein
MHVAYKRAPSRKFGCQSIRFEPYSPTLAQLIGNPRSNSRNQLPCITAATSSSLCPRVRSNSGILCARIHDRRHLPSRFRPTLRLECLILWLASSEIVGEQGHCPWWLSGPEGLLRYAAACGDTHDPGWCSFGQFA